MSTIGQTNQAHSTAGESHVSRYYFTTLFRRDVNLLFRGYCTCTDIVNLSRKGIYFMCSARCLQYSTAPELNKSVPVQPRLPMPYDDPPATIAISLSIFPLLSPRI